MTPLLIEKFGTIYVETIAAEEDFSLYARTSIIRQESTKQKILCAKIEVQKESVPAALIAKLKSTNIPFGQLLIDYNILVNIENLQLFEIINAKTNTPQYGRKVDIIDALTHALICRVEETLTS